MSNDIDIRDMRKAYLKSHVAFLECHLASNDPFSQFDNWFKDAHQRCSNFEEVNATCLATATKEGRPSCRQVLLKGYGESGFKFFSSYCSRKAGELIENPYAAMTFYWPSINRSVRLEGIVQRLTDADANDYWSRRPVDSQASAFVSNQSTVVRCRQDLADACQAVKSKYIDNGLDIPRPPTWGGYVLVPETFEFWQGQADRLHDRIRFRKQLADDAESELVHIGANGWVFERLAP